MKLPSKSLSKKFWEQKKIAIKKFVKKNLTFGVDFKL